MTGSSLKTWEEAVCWLRASPEHSALVKGGYYDDPLLDAAARYHASEEWEAVRKFLSGRSGRALDVGAGRGIASYALAREGFSVTALEPDPSNVVGAGAIRGLAKNSGLPINVVENFSEFLPFDASTFDVVFARSVLHHTSDLERACCEFYRVLRPGGVFLAIREHVISRESDLPAFLAAHPLHHLYGGENAFLLARYQSAIQTAGFVLHATLSPLKSPINFAPHSAVGIRQDLSKKLTCSFASAFELVDKLLSRKLVWKAAVNFLTLVDRRPGRLYSFVASRVA